MPCSALEPLAPSLNHGLIPRVTLPSSLWTCAVAPGLILPNCVLVSQHDLRDAPSHPFTRSLDSCLNLAMTCRSSLLLTGL